MDISPFKYYSLGDNCEVGFQLRRINRFEKDDFFGWCFSPLATTLHLIESEFTQLCDSGQIEQWGPAWAGMIRDRKYGLLMHSPFVIDGVDHFESANHERIRGFLAATMAQRARAFFRHARAGNTVYFCKYKGVDAQSDAAKLTQLLQRKAGHDRFLVVLIQEYSRNQSVLAQPNLLPAYVTGFAPEERADDADEASWDAVFELVSRQIERSSGLSGFA